MCKTSTKLETVSAQDMYQVFVRDYLKDNPTYIAKRWKHIANGEIFNSEGKKIFSYTKYKEILSLYNKRAGEKIIKGYTLDLLNGLGNLFVARIERPTNNKRLNILASKELKKKLEAEGKLTAENWKVPYVDDDFIMVMWHKGNGQMRNIHLYKFKTAGGQPGKGFRHLLSHSVIVNPLLKSIYPFLPTKRLSPLEYKSEAA